MRFEYEIPLDEYVASLTLYFKLSAGRSRIKLGFGWILAGAFFILIASNEEALNWPAILLFAMGGRWIYIGMVFFFPVWSIRRQYPRVELVGKKFQADLNEEGFEIAGDVCTWRIPWQAVPIKGENERVFMLYSSETVFMIGKKYLSEEQQREFRRLASLPSH